MTLRQIIPARVDIAAPVMVLGYWVKGVTPSIEYAAIYQKEGG